MVLCLSCEPHPEQAEPTTTCTVKMATLQVHAGRGLLLARLCPIKAEGNQVQTMSYSNLAFCLLFTLHLANVKMEWVDGIKISIPQNPFLTDVKTESGRGNS